MKELWMILFPALAIVAIAWYMTRRSRVHGEKLALKEQVQTWEDEGGNVPDVPVVSPRTRPPGSSEG